MTERESFKKPSKPVVPKPFQVSLDLKSGLHIGLGIALVQIAFALAQVVVGAFMAFLLTR